MSSALSFLDLPVVVRDTILENLDRVELASISFTCPSLQPHARRRVCANNFPHERDQCGGQAPAPLIKLPK